MWTTMMSEIWDYRNIVVYRNEIYDGEKIFSVAQIKEWIWITHLNKNLSFLHVQYGA